MIKRLMELEIPEIQDGVVIIKGVAREAGQPHEGFGVLP